MTVSHHLANWPDKFYLKAGAVLGLVTLVGTLALASSSSLLCLLAYLGGMLTIISPCILPVLPFVFARSDRPFVSSGLPMLVGMAATFAAMATLAAVGGGWAVQANQYGRYFAIVLLALFGVTLLLPSMSDRLTRPLVALGARLSETADQRNRSGRGVIWSSLVLGIATGLLWAPCAGPVLGLILTGAALNGASTQTTLLLVAYAAGAATSLALALLIGGRMFAAMKRSIGAGEWIRRGLGVAVLAAVLVTASGLDTRFLAQVSLAGTAPIEQGLVDKLRPTAPGAAVPVAMTDTASVIQPAPPADPANDELAVAMTGPTPAAAPEPAAPAPGSTLAVEGQLPPLSGAVQWLNSPPLTPAALRGKVVVVDFWTYSCINCLRSIPYVRAWYEKYKNQGLVVIGVHTPEFAFEKNIDNVKKAVADLKIDFPIAIDNDYAIWRAFQNMYWPADYFIDAQGRIRDHAFGEGDYQNSEHAIQLLLQEAGKGTSAGGFVAVNASGAQAAADAGDDHSPETYIGYGRAENFVSGSVTKDAEQVYSVGTPQLNQWGLTGDWTVGEERAVLNRKDGSIVYRFHARDLHLVLGPSSGQPVRLRVTIDGKPPGDSHGMDVDADGHGVVTNQRNTNSSVRAGLSAITPSRFGFSIRASKHTPSRSAEDCPGVMSELEGAELTGTASTFIIGVSSGIRRNHSTIAVWSE
jgi:cytochrome c biogenesis protein CcdA/thiol-disulfide isomerase/thioredoxin